MERARKEKKDYVSAAGILKLAGRESTSSKLRE